MTYGVTSTGYNLKPLSVIRDEIRDDIITAFGDSIDVVAPSAMGNLIDSIAERFTLLWEMNEDQYNSSYLTASGVNLDLVAQAQGKVRNTATYSRIYNFKFTSTGNCTVPAGSTFTDGTADSLIWSLDEEASRTGAGDFYGDLTCTTTGSNSAAIGTVTNIITPVANLSVVTNPSAASLGNDLETDAELRLRLYSESTISETSTDTGIRKAIMNLNTLNPALTTIEDCFVIENDDLTTDAAGREGKSIEVIVYYQDGGADDSRDSEVAETIASTYVVGTKLESTATTVTKSITMDSGQTKTIVFSKPTEVPLNVDVDITVNDDIYDLSDDTQTETAIQNYLNSLGVGDDCIAHGYNSLESYLSTIPGILDIDIDWAKVPTAAAGQGDSNITITYDEIAVYDSVLSTINVTSHV